MPTITTHKKSCHSKPLPKKTQKPIGSSVDFKNRYCQFTQLVDELHEPAEYGNSYTDDTSNFSYDSPASIGYWADESYVHLQFSLEEEDRLSAEAMLEMLGNDSERYNYLTKLKPYSY